MIFLIKSGMKVNIFFVKDVLAVTLVKFGSDTKKTKILK